MKSFLARIACGAVVAAGVMVGHQGQAWAQAQGDAAKGQKAFIKCQTCHRIGDGAKNLIGPILTGVVGRKAGTVEGFAYSPLNKAAGENGLMWTEEQIMAYLPDPNAFLKKFLAEKGKPELAAGTTKMVFKLASDEERRDVIAYLKTFAAK